MSRVFGIAGIGIAAALTLVSGSALAQPLELKYAVYLPPGNAVSNELGAWAQRVSEKSQGKLVIKPYFGGQLGPPQRVFDLVRTGVADMGFLLHGATPGRFPLTEISHLPGLVKEVQSSSRALTVLSQDFLEKEHPGVRPLYYFTIGPAALITSKKQIKSVADFRGLRMRAASVVQAQGLEALGAVPTNVQPADLSDALGKGMIDGVFIAYSGAAIFKLQDVAKYALEMNFGTSSFAIIMNSGVYEKLPADVKKVLDEESGVAGARAVGKAQEDLDATGRQVLINAGIAVNRIPDAEYAATADKVQQEAVAQAEAKGLPARAFLARLKEELAK